jgi:hypothetical protein
MSNLPGVKGIITVILGLAALVLSAFSGISSQTILSTNDSLLTQCGAIMIHSNVLPIASGFALGPRGDVVSCWHVLEGGRTLWQNGLQRAVTGQTTLEEIIRVVAVDMI